MTSVMPPVLATLGWMMSTALGVQHCPDLEQARRVLAGRDPTPPSRRTRARPAWCSGGQTGSSSHARSQSPLRPNRCRRWARRAIRPNVARVLAEHGRSELRIDDDARRRAAGVTEAFAPAFEHLVGDDAHQQRIETRLTDAEEGGRGGTDVAGHADQMGLDRNDLHGGLNDAGRWGRRHRNSARSSLCGPTGSDTDAARSDAAAREGVDPVGKRERLLDQLFNEQHRERRSRAAARRWIARGRGAVGRGRQTVRRASRDGAAHQALRERRASAVVRR